MEHHNTDRCCKTECPSQSQAAFGNWYNKYDMCDFLLFPAEYQTRNNLEIYQCKFVAPSQLAIIITSKHRRIILIPTQCRNSKMKLILATEFRKESKNTFSQYVTWLLEESQYFLLSALKLRFLAVLSLLSIHQIVRDVHGVPFKPPTF